MQDIEYVKQDGIAIATFNRPKKLNAFRSQSRAALLELLEDFKTDSSVKVLLLTGKGRAFSAGADLAEIHLSKEEPFDEEKEREGLEQFQSITRKLIEVPKPIIALINGLAVGVGVEIALACDIRLASQSASFALTESKRSLFQTNGVMFILPRLIGFGRAIEMMMTGRKVMAEEALQMGLLSFVYEPEALMAEGLKMASVLRDNAPISLKLIKQIGWKSMDTTLEQVMDWEVEGMLECLQSEDIWEGTQAFLEKRPAQYKGR